MLGEWRKRSGDFRKGENVGEEGYLSVGGGRKRIGGFLKRVRVLGEKVI